MRMKFLGVRSAASGAGDPNFIQAVKIVREVMGIGLREAKEMLDGRAGFLPSGSAEQLAELQKELASRLSWIGVTVEFGDGPQEASKAAANRISGVIAFAKSNPEHKEEYMRLAAIYFSRLSGTSITQDVLGGDEPWLVCESGHWNRYSHERLAYFIESKIK